MNETMNLGNTHSARKWGRRRLSVLHLSGSRPIHPTILPHNPCPGFVTHGHLFLPRNRFQPHEKPKKSVFVKSEPEERVFRKPVGGSAGGSWGTAVMWDQGTSS